jgi:transcriptional regulator with XRE-family HTH domain
MSAMHGDLFIREARLRADVSQRELARRLRTSHAAISRWENGVVSPTWETVLAAAAACGLEVRVGLVERDDDETVRLRERLQRTPSERLADLTTFVNFAQRARAARAVAPTRR